MIGKLVRRARGCDFDLRVDSTVNFLNFFYADTHICNLLGIMHTLKFRHHTKETKVVKSRNDHCIEEMETTLKSLMNERERSEQNKD